MKEKLTRHHIRCPECKIATLGTPRVLVRRETRKSEVMPIKVCLRCKVIIILPKVIKKEWKVWNGEAYINVDEKAYRA